MKVTEEKFLSGTSKFGCLFLGHLLKKRVYSHKRPRILQPLDHIAPLCPRDVWGCNGKEEARQRCSSPFASLGLVGSPFNIGMSFFEVVEVRWDHSDTSHFLSS